MVREAWMMISKQANLDDCYEGLTKYNLVIC